MRLSANDFYTPMFDVQKPVSRLVPRNASGRRERAIEGATFTDNYHKIGFTYYLSDGMLRITYWDRQKQENIRLMEKRIRAAGDFEKCVKQADRKILRYHEAS